MLPSVSVINHIINHFLKIENYHQSGESVHSVRLLSDMDGAEKKMLEEEILLLLQSSPQV